MRNEAIHRKIRDYRLEEMNRKIGELVCREDLALEPVLSMTKWYNYRFLNPLECTELFVKAYTKVFQQKWSRGVSTEDAPKKLGTRASGWMSGRREFTSFWRARQYVDQYCIPYDDFIDNALEFALRIGYERPPRPNQIFGKKHGEAMSAAAAKGWIEWLVNTPLKEFASQYNVVNFQSHPLQYSFQDDFVEILKLRESDPRDIGPAVAAGFLPIHTAYFEFGSYRMYLAEPSMRAKNTSEPIANHELRPGCYGVPHAFAGANSACSICPFAEACQRAEKSIRSAIFDAHDDDDPVNARKRRQVRDRVRLHRERKRLKTAGTVSASI